MVMLNKLVVVVVVVDCPRGTQRLFSVKYPIPRSIYCLGFLACGAAGPRIAYSVDIAINKV